LDAGAEILDDVVDRVATAPGCDLVEILRAVERALDLLVTALPVCPSSEHLAQLAA